MGVIMVKSKKQLEREQNIWNLKWYRFWLVVGIIMFIFEIISSIITKGNWFYGFFTGYFFVYSIWVGAECHKLKKEVGEL